MSNEPEPTPEPVAAAAPAEQSLTVPTTEEKNWAMFVHLSALISLVVLGGLTFVGPLVIWLIKKDQSNRLMLIVREGYLEVYVNFVAVIDPIPVDSSLTPARLNLVVFGRGAEADFDRVTVWSAAGLKPLKDRIAAVR